MSLGGKYSRRTDVLLLKDNVLVCVHRYYLTEVVYARMHAFFMLAKIRFDCMCNTWIEILEARFYMLPYSSHSAISSQPYYHNFYALKISSLIIEI